jgi:hypothetical protein
MTLEITERERIEAEGLRIERKLREAVLTNQRLMIVKAPPGSGKTTLLTRVAAAVAADPGHLRVAVACQTNSQADDVCIRLGAMSPGVPIVRFASSTAARNPRLPASVLWLTKTGDLPHDNAVVVGTSAKWGLIDLDDAFDVLFVDEAWQLAHKDFQLLTQVAPRFVLIGDPGQIPPVITVSSLRWQTLQQAPHRPTPDVLRSLPGIQVLELQLPATRRLPHDSASIVRAFYDFDFASLAGPGERAIVSAPAAGDAVDRALTHLAEASMAVLTVRTPETGPPMEVDLEVASACVRVVERALARRARYRELDAEHALVPAQIGIAATHRKMVTAIELALPASLRGQVRVDTPERWQGLECELMLAVHPLSGVRQPSDFDLETGRLCVMASRHRGGLVLVTRDHIGSTLEHTIPFARQPVGAPDVAGRGHAQHTTLWARLLAAGAIFGG